MEIPVYLFTGFLESGKTTFIQDALEGSDFNAGERTLLLICEEGVEEYDSDRFFGHNVFPEIIEEKEDLKAEHLDSLRKKHRVERVVVEYNGMWLLQEFFDAMPKDWVVYQEVTFFDAGTFLQYNRNMRSLVFDKLKTAELVVFNRCVRGGFDQMAFHKEVRVANRKSMIIYEYGKDDVEPDQIVDPLPFDLNADMVEIGDDVYAEWYRDINEEPKKYDGKHIRLKGRIARGDTLHEEEFVFGRHVMTCCVQDIQFAALLCKWKDAASLPHGGWADVRARIAVEYDPVYGEEGPVLHCESVVPCPACDPEVATF